MIRSLLCASLSFLFVTSSYAHAEDLLINEYGCEVTDLTPLHNELIENGHEFVELFREASRALVQSGSSLNQKHRLRRYRRSALKELSLTIDSSLFLIDGLSKEHLESCANVQACSVEDESYVANAISSDGELTKGHFRKLFTRLKRNGTAFRKYRKAYRTLRLQNETSLQSLPTQSAHCS